MLDTNKCYAALNYAYFSASESLGISSSDLSGLLTGLGATLTPLLLWGLLYIHNHDKTRSIKTTPRKTCFLLCFVPLSLLVRSPSTRQKEAGHLWLCHVSSRMPEHVVLL